MWRSAVQVCLGLHIAARQCVPEVQDEPGTTSNLYTNLGGLAQLARAPALQAGGQRFESVILHVVRENLIDEAQAESINKDSMRIEIFDILTHKTVSNEDFVFRN